MASWALLLALSGAQVQPGSGDISFAPAAALLSEDAPFQSFWSNGRAWGVYRKEWDADAETWRESIDVLGGAEARLASDPDGA